MALPHQVRLSIKYNGTTDETEATTAGSSASSASGSAGATYTVKSGDNLWRISKQYYGSGALYMKIYNANAAVIEATARSRGKNSSDKGHWIFPGTVLVIPDVNASSSASKVSKEKKNPNLGTKIAKQATSFTYTDVASGQSDSVSITMHDVGKQWIGKSRPKRGDGLGATLVLTNWNSETEGEKKFDCGSFTIDDVSFSGRPLSCVLGGVSVPAMDDFKSLPKTKVWEKTTVKDIAAEIAGGAGVSLHYDADTIQIAEIEQSRKTDSAFLYDLCEKYGLAMKVYNHKIVIFDFVKYEAKEAVATLKEKDLLSWSYDNTIDGTYTGVYLDYTNPDNDKTISVTLGSEGRMYSMNTQAANRHDAELQAAAKVNEANRQIETMNITIRANTKLVAGLCIKISGLESLDGKYFIDKVKHSVGKAYTMQLTLHKVQAPISAG